MNITIKPKIIMTLKKLFSFISVGTLLFGISIADSENIVIPCAIILLGILLIGIQLLILSKTLHQNDEDVVEEVQIDYADEFERLYHQYGNFPLPDADELLKKLECDA